MELKEYQKKTLDQIRVYLDWLKKAREESIKHTQGISSEFQDISFDFPKAAWNKVSFRQYFPQKNGLGEDLPGFYIKIPTGGGKTLLACHTIDLINRVYLNKQTGLVLWIVPTTQIYRQTLASLSNREHPYRQVLDIASAGRTVVLEKTDRFLPLDVKENLVVMLLMLPSASRQNKEVLRLFRDSGGFTDFFPGEDDAKGNANILKQFPNLDCYGTEQSFYGKVVKTSLGNVLRALKPIVIIDEGHKAYSDIARKTIRGFNPCILLELSATPPKSSNILVEIGGQELNNEEMIKLDLHIINKATLDWKEAILAAFDKRKSLEQKANEYEANTGLYIRPICLVQVERTGKEQQGTKYIHAEDVKDHLIKQCGVPEEEIAIKSSEKDDIEGIDLLSKDCPIRYIITKQALQEGWDCAFAYILTVLTNPGSQLSITQLVGRILRQPKAKKTKVKELDESYVFCFRPRAKELLENVKNGFESEGLGDLAGRVCVDEGDTKSIEDTKESTLSYREKFKPFEGKIYLPKFVMQEQVGWRDVNYEMDILSRVNWEKVDLNYFNIITLSVTKVEEQEIVVGLSKDSKEVIAEKGKYVKESGLGLDKVLITRQIIDIVPNPWIAYGIAEKVIDIFLAKYDVKVVSNNIVFIIDLLRKHLEGERDRLAEGVFKGLVNSKSLCFFLLASKGGYKIPSRIKVIGKVKALIRNDNSPIQRSLFEAVPEEELNEMEKSIAVYIDEQEKLLWWYRNLARHDYYIQGWKKNRIYPDFIFTDKDDTGTDYTKVYVVEAKGVHLKNEDTDYKKNVFDFCNKVGQQKDWKELALEFPNKKVEFQVIFGDEWQEKINKIFAL